MTNTNDIESESFRHMLGDPVFIAALLGHGLDAYHQVVHWEIDHHLGGPTKLVLEGGEHRYTLLIEREAR